MERGCWPVPSGKVQACYAVSDPHLLCQFTLKMSQDTKHCVQ